MTAGMLQSALVGARKDGTEVSRDNFQENEK